MERYSHRLSVSIDEFAFRVKRKKQILKQIIFPVRLAAEATPEIVQTAGEFDYPWMTLIFDP